MFSKLGEKHKTTNPQSSVNHKQKNCNESHTYACYSQTDKTNSEKQLKSIQRNYTLYTRWQLYEFFKKDA